MPGDEAERIARGRGVEHRLVAGDRMLERQIAERRMDEIQRRRLAIGVVGRQEEAEMPLVARLDRGAEARRRIARVDIGPEVAAGF